MKNFLGLILSLFIVITSIFSYQTIAVVSAAATDQICVISNLEGSNSTSYFSKISSYGFTTSYVADTTNKASGLKGVSLNFNATGNDNISNYQINLPTPANISNADYFVFYFKNNTNTRIAIRMLQFNSATNSSSRTNHSTTAQSVQVYQNGQWISGDKLSAGTGNSVDTPFVSFPGDFSGFVKIPFDSTDKALSPITSVQIMLGGGNNSDAASVASVFSGKSVTFDDFAVYGTSVTGTGTLSWDSYLSSFWNTSVYSTNPRQSFSLDNPPGPSFTAAQITAQKTAGTLLLSEITAAANNLSQTQFVIPPGDYGFAQTFYKNAATCGFMIDSIQRPDNNPFTIVAYGVTFWFDTMGVPAPTWGRAVYFNNCANITLEGLTIDSYVRNAIDGKLTKIDVPNNRIEISLLPGTFNDQTKILAYNSSTGSQCRIIPVKPNGNFIAPLYNINNTWGPEYLLLNNITKSDDGNYWLNFSNTTLLNTIFTAQWMNAYGSNGTLEIGDGIEVLYGVMGGFVVDNSKQITIKDSTCYIAKADISEDGGYGNHKWINVRLSARPGTNEIMGGGENMSAGLRVGSTYDGCYFGLTSDDAINFHGFWGVAQSISGNSVVFDRIPSGVAAGDTVEFYNTQNGQLLYTYTITAVTGSTNTDINGNRLNITVTFSQTPNSSVVSSNSTIWARYPSAECGGWTIENCSFESNYQRILIQSGPGTFENNIVNCMGDGLDLTTNYYSYEGGFLNNITIENNVFLGSSICPDTSPIYVEHTTKSTQDQWVTGITIQNNAIIGAGGEAIKVNNAKNITITGNIISDPISYTAIACPSMTRPTTAFTGSNVSNVAISNNQLFEKNIYTSGNKFFNNTATLTNNQAFSDPSDAILVSAYNAYANSSLTAEQIYNAIETKALDDFICSRLETPSDTSSLGDLTTFGDTFTENFTKNALGSLWSSDVSFFSTVNDLQAIAGNSLKMNYTNATNGAVYAFAFKNKLAAGGMYKLTVDYKVMSDQMPTGFYFGFTRDDFLNQKNIQVNFTGCQKETVYTFTGVYNLDNYNDYYLQWFNMNSKDGSIIVIDNIRLELIPVNFGNMCVSSNNTITNIQPGTTISSLRNSLNPASGTNLVITNPYSTNGSVGTGTTVDLTVNGSTTHYLVLEYGDVNGDGAINLGDLVSIRGEIIGNQSISGSFLTAGDLYGEGDISLNDLVGLMAYISGTGNINQC